MAQSFEDLAAWQRAMELAEAVYEATREFPRQEQYCLTNQIRRAAISIASNIAEGQGRANPREFRQFLCIARGSVCEVQSQLELSRRLGYGSPALIERAELLSVEVRKLLFGLLKSIAGTPSPVVPSDAKPRL